MNPRVKNVKPLADYILHLTFKNGEKKLFDVKPWLDKTVYQNLRNTDIFRKAHVTFGTVSWDEEIDFCPDILYLESKSIED